MLSKLIYLPLTDMDWIRYLTKPMNTGAYFLKTSTHLSLTLFKNEIKCGSALITHVTHVKVLFQT